MLRRVYLVVMVIILFSGRGAVAASESSATQDREHKIKAAFFYNFLNFVEWPKEKMPDNDNPIVIGVIGNQNFSNAFEKIEHQKIKGKSIDIKFFNEQDILKKEENALESLRRCHAIIICKHNDNSPVKATAIINSLDDDASVLIVGEQPKFLESGGHINFVIDKQKVRFEINLQAAEKDGLKIRSKLVRLAKRVMRDNS